MYWTVVASKPCSDEIFFTRPACTGAHKTLVQRNRISLLG